jgi:hypothetical protein
VLLLDRVSRPQSVASAHAINSQRFVLGGVAFELSASTLGQQIRCSLEPDAARYCLPANRHPEIASVLCSVAIDDALFEGANPFGVLELQGCTIADLAHGEINLSAPRVRATLCRLEPHRYVCSARVASDPRALSILLRSIVAIAVHEAGGLMMHAAGVVLSQRAVLYVGPSGQGKSTAAAHTDGARMFASDHVALIPDEGGRVLVYGMPGGKRADMPYVDDVVWPLGMILRVRRDDPSSLEQRVPRARLVQGVEALFIAREAAEAADTSKSAEDARLNAAYAVTQASAIGTVHTVLGHPIGQLVRGLLATEGQT